MNFPKYPLGEDMEFLEDHAEFPSWAREDSEIKEGERTKRYFSIDSIDNDDSFFLLTSDQKDTKLNIPVASSSTEEKQRPNQFLLNEGVASSSANIFSKEYSNPHISPFEFNESSLEPLDESKETVFYPIRNSTFAPRTHSLHYGLGSIPMESFDQASGSSEFYDIIGTRRHSIASSQSLFACPWPGCCRYFSRAYNLRSHYLIHSGSKPFICDMCGQSFARNHDMRRHIRIHSGLKPHTCSKCGKGFSRQDALTRHLRSSIKCQSYSM
jgi:uncharacterized Zn-finger protein